MKTRRNNIIKRKKTYKHNTFKRDITPGKKWTTAIEAAKKTLHKTGSYEAAKTSLKKQALTNARKLFELVKTS